MPASYPGTIKVFTSKANVVDVVDAAHVNEIQVELIAVQETLGVNPHISGQGAGSFTTVKARLDYFDVNKSQITHGHAHGNLSALTNDDHTQYLNNARHDIATRHAFGGALGTPGTPASSAPGDAGAVGTAPAPARADHKHPREPASSAAAPLDHTHARRFPHSWLVVGEIRVPVGAADYILGMYVPVPAGQGVQLVGLRYKLFSGTSATIDFLRNGAAVAGLTGLVVSTTVGQTLLATPLALADVDELRPVVTGVSGVPTHMQIAAFLNYTIPATA